MKKVIAAVLVTCGLWVSAGVAVMPEPTREEVLLDAAWEYVCDVNRTFNCDGVAKPTLVLHDGVNQAFGAYGVFFPSESIIFALSTPPNGDDQKQMQTVVHELTHYLEDQMGWQETVRDSCQWEEVAFTVGDEYARYIGREDLVRGPTWWRPYRQCQNYGE